MKANKPNKRRIDHKSRERTSNERVLIDLRRDVLSALAALERQPFSDAGEEERREEEIAAADAITEVEHRYHQGLIERLRGIEEAFERLDAGTYGMCVLCGTEISEKRLEANPAVSMCLLCQELAERNAAAVPAAVI